MDGSAVILFKLMCPRRFSVKLQLIPKKLTIFSHYHDSFLAYKIIKKVIHFLWVIVQLDYPQTV